MDAPFRLFLSQPCSSSSSSSSDHHHNHQLLGSLTTSSSPNSPKCCYHSTLRNTLVICSVKKKRPWDSNAESFRNRSYDFRYGEEDDFDKDWIEDGSGFVEKVIDNILIFKVLKSYGWMLPFIIISMLLVSGPKAFLYTLGLAIALSLIAYAFQSLTRSAPGRKSKRKKRPYTTANRSNFNAEPDTVTRTRKNKSAASWSTGNDKPFGGWDELDEAIDYKEPPVRKPDEVVPKERVESMPEPVKMPDRTRVREELRRREMSRTPLLLRLLVAAFPFLSSWIKLL